MTRSFPIARLAICAAALAVLVGCGKHAHKSRLLAQAGRDYAAGDYDKAEVEYRGALHLGGPIDPTAIAQLGFLYNEEGRPLQAVPYLKKAAELAPQRADVHVSLGQACLALGSTKDARDQAKKALAADPANEGALMLLVHAARNKADLADTRQFLQQLRGAHPDCAAYRLAAGSLLLLEGNSAEAEHELRQAIALDPKSSQAYFELANLCARRRDVQQAGEALRTAASLAPLRSLVRLNYVEYLYASKKADEARSTLAEITEKAPDYVPALDYTMRIALAERRFADCQAAMDKLLQRDPRHYDALVTRAVLKAAQGDTAAAVDAYQKAEAVYPRSPQIEFQLALVYLTKGDMTKAEERLNQALALAPEFDQAALVLADLDLRKADPAAAIALLHQLIERHPQTGRAYNLLARAYVKQKNPEQALAVYQRMAAVLPKDPKAPYFRGLVLAQQKRGAEARQAFEKALEIEPAFGPALEMVVGADIAEKHIDAAAARVEGLIRKYPKSAGPWMLRAKVDAARRDVAACESDLLKAIELNPNAQVASIELAQLYLATHQTAQAIEKLTALAQRTHSATALLQLGAIHTYLGQYADARADYEKVLAANPDSAPALNNLAYLCSEHLGKIDEAYGFATRAREAAPDDPSTADTLGWILYQRGDYHGALELVQECAQERPDDPEMQFHLGMIYCRLGEEEPASEAFQLALAVRAGAQLDAERARTARQRLAVLAIDPATATRADLANLENRAKADPDDPIVLARLGSVEAQFGESEQAAKTLTAALKLTPRNTAAMLVLAQLDSGPLRDPAQARLLAKTAHEIAPNDPRISENLGNLLYRMGDYPRSLDLLQEAARAEPDRTALQVELASAQYAAGRVSEAGDTLKRLLSGGGAFAQREEAGRLAAMIAAGSSPEQAQASASDARKLLEANPDFLPAMMVWALALERQGGPGAAEAYEKILAKDPYFTPATRQLALIWVRRTGNDQKAYDLAVKAREAYPDDPRVATALGIMDYRRGSYEEAIHLLQQSLREREDDGETAFYLGMSLLGAKRTSEAKAELKLALGLNLPAREADDARRALDDMKSDETGGHGTDATVPGLPRLAGPLSGGRASLQCRRIMPVSESLTLASASLTFYRLPLFRS